MSLRPLHVVLVLLAVPPALLGIDFLRRGILDRSYDNTIWNYLVPGGLLLILAVALVAVALNDARRRSRAC